MAGLLLGALGIAALINANTPQRARAGSDDSASDRSASPVYSSPPRSVSPVYSSPPRSPSPTYGSPPRSPSPTYSSPPRSPSPTYSSPPRSPSPTYSSPPRSPSPTDSSPARSVSPAPSDGGYLGTKHDAAWCSDDLFSTAGHDVELCLYCNERPKTHDTRFCEYCQNKSWRKAPLLVGVPEEHPAFQEIVSHFQNTWTKPRPYKSPPRPTVVKVFKVVQSFEHDEEFAAHASRVGGTIERYWHGTSCKHGWDIHQDRISLTSLFRCRKKSCGLCCILRGSYNLSGAGKNWIPKFGFGIYTSQYSSTSHQYLKDYDKRRVKALLLNKVAVGDPYRIRNSDSHKVKEIRKAPRGYDSVMCDDVPYNAHECIVYEREAIQPSWLVFYED